MLRMAPTRQRVKRHPLGQCATGCGPNLQEEVKLYEAFSEIAYPSPNLVWPTAPKLKTAVGQHDDILKNIIMA